MTPKCMTVAVSHIDHVVVALSSARYSLATALELSFSNEDPSTNLSAMTKTWLILQQDERFSGLAIAGPKRAKRRTMSPCGFLPSLPKSTKNDYL